MKKQARELRYAQDISRMLQIDTVRRPGADGEAFDSLHELLAELFPEIYKSCRKWEFDGSLLYCWPGRAKDRPLLLMSHQDVVAAEGNWTYPPFSGAIENGKLWGRGALDVKANLYCILQAVEELIAEGVVPPQDVYIASSHEEEVGGNDLIVDFLKAQGIRPHLLVDEGTAVQTCPIPGVAQYLATIAVAEKGYADIKCIARSKGGHSSAPGKGTPLPRLGAFMCQIERDGLFPVTLDPASKEMYRRLAKAADGETAETLRKIAEEEPGWQDLLTDGQRDMLTTTVAFTMAGGSDAPNVIPGEAFVTCNLRIAPGTSVADVEAAMGRIASQHQIELQILRANEPSPITDPGSEAFRAVEQAAKRIWPELGVIPFLLAGGTDTKHFVDLCPNCLRFTPMVTTPEQRAAIHGVDEHIDIAVLPEAVDFFKTLILEQ